MAYEKTVWATGGNVTSTKLNHMENGVDDHNPLMVNLVYEDNTATFDKTWQEIYDAFSSGKTVITKDEGEVDIEYCLVVEIYPFRVVINGAYFESDSANGYPSIS